MNVSLMLNSHGESALEVAAPWAWTLVPQEARTLHPEPVARWLRVERGSVWLTRANGAAQADDIWLAAGQSLALPPGSAWGSLPSPSSASMRR